MEEEENPIYYQLPWQHKDGTGIPAQGFWLRVMCSCITITLNACFIYFNLFLIPKFKLFPPSYVFESFNIFSGM